VAQIKIIPYSITFGPWLQTFQDQQVAPNIFLGAKFHTNAKSKNDL